MLYDISCFNETKNLDEFIRPKNKTARFFLETALRWCQCSVQNCIVQRIDTCTNEQLSDLIDTCLSRFDYDVQSDTADNVWCRFIYGSTYDVYIYGGPSGLHAWEDGGVVEGLVAYLFDKYILHECAKSVTTIGCLFIWALSKVYDLSIPHLADSLRIRDVKRRDIMDAMLSQEMFNMLDDIAVEIDDTIVHMPEAGAVCLHTYGLIMETAIYLP